MYVHTHVKYKNTIWLRPFRHEEDMYNTVMGNFEKRCTVLQSENRRLRDVLADIQIEMYELSNSAIPGGTSPRKTHSPRANKGTQIL